MSDSLGKKYNLGGGHWPRQIGLALSVLIYAVEEGTLVLMELLGPRTRSSWGLLKQGLKNIFLSSLKTCSLKKILNWVDKVAQQVKALGSKSVGENSVPETHIVEEN